jgi:hypothetical protein
MGHAMMPDRNYLKTANPLAVFLPRIASTTTLAFNAARQ